MNNNEKIYKVLIGKYENNDNRWLLVDTNEKEFTQEQYDNYMSFKNGIERRYRTYTSKGFIITKVISTCPDYSKKSIARFYVI